MPELHTVSREWRVRATTSKRRRDADASNTWKSKREKSDGLVCSEEITDDPGGVAGKWEMGKADRKRPAKTSESKARRLGRYLRQLAEVPGRLRYRGGRAV